MAYMEYTTLADLKSALPNTGLTDPQLTALITRASLLLDAELWDNIGEQTLTKRIDWYGKAKVVMENNVNEVVTIEYKNGSGRSELTVDWIEWPVIYLEEIAPVGEKNIKVEYKKWYTVLPKDIQSFFHMYVGQMLIMEKWVNGSTQWELKSKSINGLHVSYRTPLEIAESMMWDNWAFAETYKKIVAKYKNFTFAIV